MGDLTDNFSAYEFECPCCGQSDMHPGTLARLQLLRDDYGKSMSFVEGGGYRCKDYDSKSGAHFQGRAVDPAPPKADLYPLMALAIKHGFTGIGIKNKGGRWQLHLDDCEDQPGVRPRPWVWTY